MAAFSSDGRYLASAGEDDTVRVWEVSSRRQLAKITARIPSMGYTMDGVAFSPDASTIAFAGARGELRLWRWRVGDPSSEHITSFGARIKQVAFSSDGSRVTAVAGGVDLSAVTTRSKQPATMPAIHPLQVRTCDLVRRHVESMHGASDIVAISVALSPAANLVATTSMLSGGIPVSQFPIPKDATGRLLVREVEAGRAVSSIDNAGHILPVFSPNERLLLAGQSVWDIKNGKLVREVPSNSRDFTADSKSVLVLDGGIGVPWELFASTHWIRPRLIDLETGRSTEGQRIVFPEGSRGMIGLSATMSPDRRYFVDMRLDLWRIPL